MSVNLIPFNLDLLILSDKDTQLMRPIKVLDIMIPSTKNFHPDGLFSTEIFGKVGDERRNRVFSYIELNTKVFHPTIFKVITDLKGLYQEIMAGTTYAIFDKETKDFVKSDVINGSTGYNFFMSHFNELIFEEKPSPKREFGIRLIDKNRKNCLIEKMVVMPAGLRDYVIDKTGKPSEDEINTLYRKLMNLTSIISNIDSNSNKEYLDTARYNIQIAISNIYEYIKNMLEGKNKFIQGRWASRKIFNSTRNVVTSYSHEATELFGKQTLSSDKTAINLYQYMRMNMPLMINQMRTGFLSDVFVGPNVPAILVNKKTLRKESISIDSNYYDEWMTAEGLEQTLMKFSQEALRHQILELNDHYLGLLYKGPDGTYKLLQDIEDLPEDRDKKDVHPLTFVELIYLSIYKESDTIPALITRYPISGYGSIYPSYIYLKTTIRSEIREELNDNWEKSGYIANEFPVNGLQFYNSMSVSARHIRRLNADYDR